MFFLKNPPSFSAPRTVAAALAGALLCAGAAHAEVINHQWIGGDGDWATKANWNPAPASVIGSGASSALDRVTISGQVTVTRTGDLLFSGLGKDALKAGTIDAVTLLNGATLNVTGNFRVSSASGSPNTVSRNVLIDSGTSLIVGGDITTGIQNSSSVISTWVVRGSVEGNRFLGLQSTSGTLNGGFILNIDGGSFSIAESFNFKSAGGTLENLIGRINLSGNGIFTVGEILNWTGSSENYINFLDGSGVFTFAHSTWTTKADVEELIERGFIRKGESVSGDFNIVDTGTAWQVSIAAIPEPSGVALVAFGAGAAMLLLRKAESGRR